MQLYTEVIEIDTFAYETPVGEGYLQAEGDTVICIFLPGSARPDRLEKSPAKGTVGDILRFLEAYFHGEEKQGGPGIPALLNGADTTGFARRVMEEVAGIPFGHTRSYGEVAAAAGSPRASRAVGNIMAKNPFPVLVPCHRVVRSSGEPGGFGGGPGLKVWMLEMEKGTAGRDPLC